MNVLISILGQFKNATETKGFLYRSFFIQAACHNKRMIYLRMVEREGRAIVHFDMESLYVMVSKTPSLPEKQKQEIRTILRALADLFGPLGAIQQHQLNSPIIVAEYIETIPVNPCPCVIRQNQ